MPFANFTKVREVSSEDDVHTAENLVKQQGKKWKTKTVGEKSAYVILEMQEEAQIKGIDIGNEHSAFVEVLVGKSTSPPDNFTEILITCSFMTPIESRSSNNINRVRCFNQDALVPSVAEKKWSLIKIICTQPFNKHVQYGLSFIKVHIAQTIGNKHGDQKKTKEICENENKPPKVLHIGKFKLREDSPDSEKESQGGSSSLFNRWKKCKDNIGEQTTADSIRIATNDIINLARRSVSIDKPQTSTLQSNNIQVLDRNREELLFDKSDDVVRTEREKRLVKQIEADKERRRLELQKQAENKQKEKRKSLDASQLKTNNYPTKVEKTLSLSISKARNSSKEVINSPPQKVKSPTTQYRPFNQLFNGVVLVISGIQNPDRGDLRNKAVALGAKYKGDWDSTCTHLICAFKNTPKYNQVKGKGKIVTRAWIEKSYQLKKYLPWRRYALDSQELTKPESDEEILDETFEPRSKDIGNSNVPSSSRKDSEDRNDTLSLYELDALPSTTAKRRKMTASSSDSDTDDEIQRIKKRNISISLEKEQTQPSGGQRHKSDESKPSTSTNDIYDASTDEEDYLQSKQNQAIK